MKSTFKISVIATALLSFVAFNAWGQTETKWLRHTTYDFIYPAISNAQVGIGTTSPGYGRMEILHNSTAGVTGAHLTLNEYNPNGIDFARLQFMNSPVSGVPRFWQVAAKTETSEGSAEMNFLYNNGSASSNWLTLRGNGRIGINNTSPDYRLHVRGNRIRLSSDGDLERYVEMRTDGLALDLNANKGDLYIRSNTGNTILQSAGGNVGINHATPSVRLHVKGNRMRLSSDSDIERFIEMRTDDPTALDLNANKGDLRIQANTGRLILSSNGNAVGILKAPDSGFGLDVAGKTRFDATGTNDFVMDTAQLIVSAPGASPILKVYEPALFPNVNISVSASGVGTIGKPRAFLRRVYTAEIHRKSEWSFSDERIKTNIADIASPLEKILRLRGVKYDFIAETSPDTKGENLQNTSADNKNNLGFIAQEVKEVLPELVKFDPDVNLYLVNYEGVIPVLVGAVQEQQQEITEQRTLLAEKDFQIENLETRLARLEAMLLGQGAVPTTTQPASVSERAAQAANKIQTCFPNPATNTLTVTLESVAPAEGKTWVSLFDATGKEVKKADIQAGASSQDLFVGNLPAGVYSVALFVGGKIESTSLVVIAR